jgi:GNAT superfamily N-acetyltransferase
MHEPRIRLAVPADIATLQEIERRAASRFTDVGLPAATALPLVDHTTHTAAIAIGGSFIVEQAGQPCAFAIVQVFADAVHLREIDALPEQTGQGLGRRLIEHIATWAEERGAPRLTLTTYRDVPFNAPYYQRRGFHILEDPLPPRLAAERAAERAAGIEVAPRVAMARELRQR